MRLFSRMIRGQMELRGDDGDVFHRHRRQRPAHRPGQQPGVALAINGVFGNMGVASAALLSGFLIDASGWRSTFFYSGRDVHGYRRALSVVCPHGPGGRGGGSGSSNGQSTKIGPAGCKKPAGPIFQITTLFLPENFDVRLTDFAGTATPVGRYAFVVFSVAALAQLVVGYLLDAYSLRLAVAVVAITQASFFIIITHLNGIPSLLVAIGFILAVFGLYPSTMFWSDVCRAVNGVAAPLRSVIS